MRLCHVDQRRRRPGGTSWLPRASGLLQPGPAPGHGKGRRVRKQPAFKFPRHRPRGTLRLQCCQDSAVPKRSVSSPRPDYATAHGLGGAS